MFLVDVGVYEWNEPYTFTHLLLVSHLPRLHGVGGTDAHELCAAGLLKNEGDHYVPWNDHQEHCRLHLLQLPAAHQARWHHLWHERTPRCRRPCLRSRPEGYRYLCQPPRPPQLCPASEGINFYMSLPRARFEELCQDLLRSTVEPVGKVLRDSKIATGSFSLAAPHVSPVSSSLLMRTRAQ
ncbi:hypothetical protein DFH06DRAFT_759762 [Mycena polygramma]|nr:hypothetical protein DFH06DRAFT_759762 [Mycena polygramma]